ncbi:MAG: hypothetical protein ABSE39_08325 [Candidatus Bathyarchaeia archaeon]|jgi:hypothetical protein
MRRFSAILRFLRENDLRNVDDVAILVSDIFEESPAITKDAFKLEIRKIKSDFFRINHLQKGLFADQIFRAVSSIRERIPEESLAVKKQYEFVSVEEIESFEKARSVDRDKVRRLLPIELEEEKIKQSLAAIVGEEFIQKDWGGEKSDLFTSRLRLRGRRCLAAFMLKGRGTPRKLTIADCGKNGDQILRLVEEPADLFIVQHIREIDSSVVDLLERLVAEKSMGRKKLFYCVIDGVDTARILLAYKKEVGRKT